MVGRSCFPRMCSTILKLRKLWVSAFPWLRSNPIYGMKGLRMLTCWHDTELMVQKEPYLLWRFFIQMPKPSEQGFLREWQPPPLQSSEVQSLFLLQSISLSLIFFMESSGSFWRMAEYQEGKQTSLLHNACTVCCYSWASKVVPKFCSWVNFRSRSWCLLEILGCPEAFFTTIESLLCSLWCYFWCWIYVISGTFGVPYICVYGSLWASTPGHREWASSKIISLFAPKFSTTIITTLKKWRWAAKHVNHVAGSQTLHHMWTLEIIHLLDHLKSYSLL